MSDVSVVLPPNAAAWETACAVAMSDHLPVPVAQIVDPAQTPVDFLPWLAGHESVDLWYSDWPEARKRTVIANAWRDAAWKGTRAGAVAFLSYVDAELLDVVAYPRPFIVGRVPMGAPVNHPPFLARYLVKVDTVEPRNAFVIGRAAVGRAATRDPDMTPIERCLTALRAARAPETQIRVSFAHHRPLSIEDAPALDAGQYLGEWVAQANL